MPTNTMQRSVVCTFTREGGKKKRCWCMQHISKHRCCTGVVPCGDTLFLRPRSIHSAKVRKSRDNVWSSWFCSHFTRCCVGTRSNHTVLTLNHWHHLCTAGHTWENISVQRSARLAPKATESTICAVGHTHGHTHTRRGLHWEGVMRMLFQPL